jgi:hypothetical protein
VQMIEERRHFISFTAYAWSKRPGPGVNRK